MSNLEELPPDARAFINAAMKVVAAYMPGSSEIEFMVGLNTKATITIVGAPISKELLSEVLSQLTRYRKFFPDDNQPRAISSAAGIMEELERVLAEHRAAQAATAQSAADAAPQPS